MFKVLILQKYHGLSDDATEDKIGDRLIFLHFLDLQFGDEIPDAKTIWVFKERIEKASVMEVVASSKPSPRPWKRKD